MPSKSCTIVAIRLVSAYKTLLFFAVGGQRELLGALTFTSTAAQTHFCQEESREAPSTRHPRTQKPPGNLKRRKLSDQIKFSCSAGESGNSKTRILSPWGGEYTSPGVKSARGFNPGPYHYRAYLGLLGWRHWPSHPVPEAREDHGLPLSSFFPSLNQLMSTGLEGRGGGCQPLPLHHALTPLSGKWVILLSHFSLFIPQFALPPWAFPGKSSLSSCNTTLQSTGVWVEMEEQSRFGLQLWENFILMRVWL